MVRIFARVNWWRKLVLQTKTLVCYDALEFARVQAGKVISGSDCSDKVSILNR